MLSSLAAKQNCWFNLEVDRDASLSECVEREREGGGGGDFAIAFTINSQWFSFSISPSHPHTGLGQQMRPEFAAIMSPIQSKRSTCSHRPELRELTRSG